MRSNFPWGAAAVIIGLGSGLLAAGGCSSQSDQAMESPRPEGPDATGTRPEVPPVSPGLTADPSGPPFEWPDSTPLPPELPAQWPEVPVKELQPGVTRFGPDSPGPGPVLISPQNPAAPLEPRTAGPGTDRLVRPEPWAPGSRPTALAPMPELRPPQPAETQRELAVRAMTVGGDPPADPGVARETDVPAGRDPTEPFETGGGSAAGEPRDASETPAAPAEEDYKIVSVFYGTDRKPVEVGSQQSAGYLRWLYLTLGVAGITLILTAVAVRLSPGRSMMVLAGTGIVATAGLGIVTVLAWFETEAALAGPSRQYGNERGTLELGTCQVSIPKHHREGQVERPSVFKLEFREDPRQHVVLLDVHEESPEAFYTGLRARVQGSPRKEAFVFVHGFNVTFENAARRTAQLAYDLDFQGAPIFYSWPSQGGLLQYAVDETNAVWTVPHLKELLTGVARQSDAESVHLIAHSMGNRALTSAL